MMKHKDGEIDVPTIQTFDGNVVSVIYKIAKNGVQYKLITAIITIDGADFVRSFALFPKREAGPR